MLQTVHPRPIVDEKSDILREFTETCRAELRG